MRENVWGFPPETPALAPPSARADTYIHGSPHYLYPPIGVRILKGKRWRCPGAGGPSPTTTVTNTQQAYHHPKGVTPPTSTQGPLSVVMRQCCQCWPTRALQTRPRDQRLFLRRGASLGGREWTAQSTTSAIVCLLGAGACRERVGLSNHGTSLSRMDIMYGTEKGSCCSYVGWGRIQVPTAEGENIRGGSKLALPPSHLEGSTNYCFQPRSRKWEGHRIA